MRRFFILSVFLPFIINVCVLSAAGRLFIAGDAVSDGLVQSLAADVQGDGSVSWHGELAPVMHPEGDDVFTFTGWFAADKEFKFIQDRNWGGGYYNAAGITGFHLFRERLLFSTCDERRGAGTYRQMRPKCSSARTTPSSFTGAVT